MKIIRLMISFILLVIVFSNINFAQTDKGINDIASTLKQKVLLSNDQEKSVINILTELKNNISSAPQNKESFIKEAQSKVESILDKKQKIKYQILKNDIWKNF